MKVKAEQGAEPVTVDLANVKTINPRPPLRTNLRANAGFSMTDGNTDKQDIYGDAEFRASLGVGVGYQFIEYDRTNLSLEGGLSYVDENYIIAEDNSFAAGRGALKFDHFILPKSLQYFLYHTALQSAEDSDDLVLFTQTGFRIPFYKNLNITAQINWEYDKSPSPGKKESDYNHLLTLGYLWSN